MKPLDGILTSLLFTTPLLHLILSPYTKVEESFNLQATHDILVYGISPFSSSKSSSSIDNTYDHINFPGAVPRTFTGAVLLAGLSQPFIGIFGFQHAQFIVRAVLGSFNAACLFVFKRSLERSFGVGVGRWWTVLIVSQFHVAYYLSRTLPNMYAFGLTTLAFAWLLPQSNPRKATVRRNQSLAALTLATAIFRSELAILLVSTGIYLLLVRQIHLLRIVPTVAVSAIAALVLSVPLDSYFWRKWLWPEAWGFYFNAVQGSSSNWGTSPWHYYFSSALPRLLLNPIAIPLMMFALLHPGTKGQARQLTVPSLLFIAIYSFQPHKEARFIFYAIPPLTAAAALGANFVTTRFSKSILYKALTLSLLGSVLTTFVLSTGMLLISSLNYPGGHAISQLQSLVSTDRKEMFTTVSAHADVLTCMTGLTLFLQNPLGLPLALASVDHRSPDPDIPLLLIDKMENEVVLGWPKFWKKFDYVLVEDQEVVLGEWEVLGVVQGFDGIETLRPGQGSVGRMNDEELAGERRTGDDKILGLGAVVADIRDFVRRYTRGWWIGPRMVNRIHILKNLEPAR